MHPDIDRETEEIIADVLKVEVVDSAVALRVNSGLSSTSETLADTTGAGSSGPLRLGHIARTEPKAETRRVSFSTG